MGPQGRSGRVSKILATPEFDSRTLQPITSRYTNCATPAQYLRLFFVFCIFSVAVATVFVVVCNFTCCLFLPCTYGNAQVTVNVCDCEGERSSLVRDNKRT